MPKTYLIADPSAEAGALETRPDTPGVTLLSRQQLAADAAQRFAIDDRVIITSEAIMDDVLDRMDDAQRANVVGQFKDKVAFRRLLAGMYPDFRYDTVLLEDLPDYSLDPGQRYVVKPSKGCFGSGVRVVDGDVDLATIAGEIEGEIARNGAVLSDAVLSKDELIIESYIEGEEYAVDMFFDSQGRPVITNIYHHPMPANPAYLHMIYYTSAAVFDLLHAPLMDFFTQLNDTLQVRQLPIHAEFRYHQGRLVPIEFNSLRFGGMGLCNLAWHTLGVDAYAHFVNDTAPDWNALWDEHGDALYAYFIAYNGTDVDVQTQQPDWERFRQLFSRVHLETPFDYQKQLAFGTLVIEEPDQPALLKLLNTDFNDYFVPLQQ